MAEVFVGPVAQGYASGEVTVLLASPRSFCAGVERAIETVKRVLDVAEGPVYVRKQIVHNTVVVAELRDRGAVFVEDLDEIPDPPPPGAVVVFSAHGVSPAVRAGADERGLQVVDATCPLVAKVHAEAARFAARGDTVVFIGHAGHEETEGTLGVAPRSTLLVQTPADVAALNLPEGTQLSYLTQTTLALDETADVIDALRARFPTLGQPPSEDICYATTNRQRALQSMVGECDVVLVIGSCNSSNSRRLVELAQRSGTPAYLIDGPDDIEPEWLSSVSTIGVTAGASAPPRLVGQVIDALRGYASITVVERSIATETVRFGLPNRFARNDNHDSQRTRGLDYRDRRTLRCAGIARKPAARAGRADASAAHRNSDGYRWPSRRGTWHGRADHRIASGVHLATRHRGVRHRAPNLSAQAAHRPR